MLQTDRRFDPLGSDGYLASRLDKIEKMIEILNKKIEHRAVPIEIEAAMLGLCGFPLSKPLNNTPYKPDFDDLAFIKDPVIVY